MNDSVTPLAADRQTLPAQKSRMRRVVQLLLQGDRPYALYGAFAILLVVFSFASPWFLSIDNFLNIGRQTALVSIIAIGMTFVIIARQIDLSVGSTLALSGMSAALAMAYVGDNWIIGAIAGIGTGAIVGAINGVVTTRLNIPSFLVTLGTLSAARGLALMVTTTKPVIITNDSFIAIFGEGDIAGVPVPIIWTVLAVIAGILLLHYSVFGRQIYAAGGNPTAALYSGINTTPRDDARIHPDRHASRARRARAVRALARGTARRRARHGTRCDRFVTLGGCSLFGGRGFVLGTLLGSLIIGTLNNGLVLLGVSSSLQLVIKGVIIVAAVAFTRK